VADSDVAEIFNLLGTNSGTAGASAGGNSFSFSSYERLDLNGADDLLRIIGTASLSDYADGGTETDLLDYSLYTGGSVNVDLKLNTATAINGNLIGTTGDSSFENVYGSAAADTIQGDGTANLIRGYGSADTLLGLEGEDTLDGGDGTSGVDGADVIAGGSGADLILGSDGSDFISGGGASIEGSNFSISADTSTDTLSYADENEGLDISLTGSDAGTVKADAAATLSASSFTGTYNADAAQTLSAPTNQVGSSDWTDTYGDIQRLVLSNQNDMAASTRSITPASPATRLSLSTFPVTTTASTLTPTAASMNRLARSRSSRPMRQPTSMPVAAVVSTTVRW
jgi:hypothetical protein